MGVASSLRRSSRWSRSNELRATVRQRYAAVARDARGQFPYPVGPESLGRLGYAREWIAALPPDIAARFVGVGNPFAIRRPRPGERVLDVGCGCGADTFIAASLVGATGRAVGLDSTPEMLAWPSRFVAPDRAAEFVESSAEEIPFGDGNFDLVISNGALNLATDKERAFDELARVLRPQGEMVIADLVVRESIPEEMLASMDAWST